MRDISIKGLAISVVVLIILAIPIGISSRYLSSYFYKDMAQGVDIKMIVYHPISIAYGIVSLILLVGIPGYISAYIANKAYILNSMIIGIIVALWYLATLGLFPEYNVIVGIQIMFSLVIAFSAGLLRKMQNMSNDI